uniref:Uncharacterized protein n=1 Tax=Anguilla anguilla TaxID=7936 RepID=A0A0E9S342_ANGAN
MFNTGWYNYRKCQNTFFLNLLVLFVFNFLIIVLELESAAWSSFSFLFYTNSFCHVFVKTVKK